jgi:hypothetical protein
MVRLIPGLPDTRNPQQTTEDSMRARSRRVRRGRPRQPVPKTLPDDLYSYSDDPVPSLTPQQRRPSPQAFDVEKLPVIDDWPEKVPVTEAEFDIFERYFGDVLDRLFGPIDDPKESLKSLSPDDKKMP